MGLPCVWQFTQCVAFLPLLLRSVALTEAQLLDIDDFVLPFQPVGSSPPLFPSESAPAARNTPTLPSIPTSATSISSSGHAETGTKHEVAVRIITPISQPPAKLPSNEQRRESSPPPQVVTPTQHAQSRQSLSPSPSPSSAPLPPAHVPAVALVPFPAPGTAQVTASRESNNNGHERLLAAAAANPSACCSRRLRPPHCTQTCFGPLSHVVASDALGPRQSPTSSPWLNSRLPSSLSGTHYSVRLRTSVENPVVWGWERITLAVTAAAPLVIIHSYRQNITQMSLSVSSTSDPLPLSDAFFHPDLDYLVIQPTSALQVGSYELTLRFQYLLATDAVGFFKTFYRKPTGEKVNIAATHFEAVYARRAFPCLDEPAMKANFSLALVVPRGKTAISNMPISSSVPVVLKASKEKFTRVSFLPSPRMSTYLLAITITDFKYLETKTKRGLPIRVYTAPHLLEDGHLALQVTPEVLQFYEARFGIEYKLPKLDVIMLPDFKSGSAAMENWGLITFSVSSLLYDKRRSTTHALQQVTSVIAHELAHQWFGNLVTMRWWTDLWLNEGFATYADYMALTELRPEWRMDEQLLSRLQRALVMDSLETSRPVHGPVGGRRSEISPTFDGISYSKGCALVRMVQEMVSRSPNDTIFFQGLHRYLTKFEFSNTVDTDLWDAIDEVRQRSPHDHFHLRLADVMRTWTHQSGYPVVSVAKDGVTISQRRFRMAPRRDEALSSQRWSVPFFFATRSNPHEKYLHFLTENEVSARVSLLAPPNDVSTGTGGIFLGNLGRKGFYRVNYSARHWAHLAAVLRETSSTIAPIISPIDRAGLLDDAFELGRAAAMKYQHVLGLTEFLSGEKAYVPWLTALIGFSYMKERLSHSRVRVMLDSYVRALLTPAIASSKSGKHEARLLTALLFSAGWVYEHPKTRVEAMRLWGVFRKRPFDNVVPSDLLPTVLHAGVESGGDEEWEFVWSLYNSPRFSFAHRHHLATALTTTRNPWLLSRLLDLSLDRSRIRGNDCLSIFYGVARNPVGTDLMWQFFKRKFFQKNMRRLPMSHVISIAFSHLHTDEHLKDFQRFFSSVAKDANRRAVRQAAELIRSNVRWRARNEKPVCRWLSRKSFGDSTECSSI